MLKCLLGQSFIVLPAMPPIDSSSGFYSWNSSNKNVLMKANHKNLLYAAQIKAVQLYRRSYDPYYKLEWINESAYLTVLRFSTPPWKNTITEGLKEPKERFA